MMVIKPAQRYSQELLLNEWSDFNQVGAYQIEETLAKPVSSEQGKLLGRDQGFVQFTITPPDEVDVAKTCDALAAQIEGSSSYENNAFLERTGPDGTSLVNYGG
jgi:hypothetical protein